MIYFDLYNSTEMAKWDFWTSISIGLMISTFALLGYFQQHVKNPDESFHRERVTDVTAFPAILAKPPGLGVI